MAYLVDTSVLLRFTNADDAQHDVATAAIRSLHARGQTLHLAPQVLIEFRNAATRPAVVNGLGLIPAVADQRIQAYEAVFPLLEETPAIYPAWKSIVSAAGVVGKQVHDARPAAVCQVHGITHVLTFNVRHFARFIPLIPTLSIVDPASA